MRSRPFRSPASARFGGRVQLSRALAFAVLGASVAACGALPPAPERTVLAGSDIGLSTLTQPPEPPEILARTPAELPAAAAAADDARLADLAGRDQAETRAGPELAFFFESEIGRAYLGAGRGKALARGEPAETCTAFGAALDRSSARDAAGVALERCLASRGASETGCACRLIAAGPVLLAPPEAFEYARSASARLISRGPEGPIEASLVVDGPDPTADPTEPPRRLILRNVRGQIGAVVIASDGAAELVLGEEIYRGAWSAEGRRRGRVAGVLGLRSEAGRPLAVFIGYEPAEVAERRTELLARSGLGDL